MGKFLVLGVAVLLAGVLRLSTADWENVSIPFLGSAAAANSAAASAEAIGTPSAVSLPESEPGTWFEDAESGDGDAARWNDILHFTSAASTPAGWAEACKKAGTAAGADRASNAELGALACSSDPTVTELQVFAVELLAARAELALWVLGIPGHDGGAVAARLAEVRHSCENGLASRLSSEGSPYEQACTAVRTTVPLAGNSEALSTALEAAYGEVADDLATRDPSIDPEPPAAVAASTPAAS